MKIYKVSLDDDVELSRKVLDNIKLMAYLVYDLLSEYEHEMGKNILFKDGITRNELFEGYIENADQYFFEHADYENGIYEPFMLNDTSFGFTVYDNSITDEEIRFIIKEARGIVFCNYNFKLSNIRYDNKKDRLPLFSAFYPDRQVGKVRTKSKANMFPSFLGMFRR